MLNNPEETIFVGKKPLMTYVNSTIIKLSATPSVILKARGLNIELAVDVAQVIKQETNAFEIGTVKISSESLESKDGKFRNVSVIEIPVKRTW